MRKLIIAALLLLFPTSIFAADYILNPYTGKQDYRSVTIEEQDGSPTGEANKIIVDNSTLTDNEDGSFTIDLSAVGSGSPITVDLGDDGGDDTTDLAEIAPTGDTNSIFGVTGDKLTIDVSANWPTADVAAAGDSATAFFSEGTVEIARLPSIDEDNMASDSDQHLPTQQSVKAYVDANAAALSADAVNDTHIDWGTGANQVSGSDLPDEDLGDMSVSSGAWSIDADVIGTAHLADADWGDFSVSSGSATLDSGVVAAAELAATITFSDGDFLDFDGVTHTGSADEGLAIPKWADVSPTSDKNFIAVDEATGDLKWYNGGWLTAAAQTVNAGASFLTLGLDGTLSAERVLTAGEGIDFTDAGANSTLTILGEDASTTNKGIASFDADDFDVTAGVVSIDNTNFTLADLSGTLPLTQLATTGTWTPTATLDISGATVTFGLEAGDIPDLSATYEPQLANSAGLAAALSDETGTGVAVFGTNPTLTGATLGGNLAVGAYEIQSTGNIVLQLGDAAGAYNFEIEDSGGVTVFSVNSDGATTTASVNDPYIMYPEDDAASKFATRHNDDTTDAWEVGLTTSNPNDNWTELFQIDVNGDASLLAGGFNIPTGETYKINSTQIALTNLSDGLSHASGHERGGADEIDGDHLDIDFTPSNYTPATTPAEAANVDDLAAHLQGIDTVLGASGTGTIAGMTDTDLGSLSAGHIMVWDGTDDWENKAVSGDATLASDGALTIANNAVENAMMADNAIDSAEIASGAIDLAHMSAESVDSDQYVDGSIDAVHLAADVIDETKLADDSLDSEHYNDDSIDDAHINWGTGANQVSIGDIPGASATMIIPAIVVKDPDADSDYPIFRAPYALTITAVRYLCVGGTSWTGQIQEADANGGSGVDTQAADTTASAGTTTSVTSFSNAAIDSGDWLLLNSASISGTPTSVSIQIEYTID